MSTLNFGGVVIETHFWIRFSSFFCLTKDSYCSVFFVIVILIQAVVSNIDFSVHLHITRKHFGSCWTSILCFEHLEYILARMSGIWQIQVICVIVHIQGTRRSELLIFESALWGLRVLQSTLWGLGGLSRLYSSPRSGDLEYSSPHSGDSEIEVVYTLVRALGT